MIKTKHGICILGSTGSIGRNTLNVIQGQPDLFEVIALSANQSIEILFEQCCAFNPYYAVLCEPKLAVRLQTQLKECGLRTQVLVGMDGLCAIASLPEVTKVVTAMVGGVGLLPLMSALKAGKQLLLANKEPLVMAGPLLLQEAKKHGAVLLPMDSEHNALFQCMPPHYVAGVKPPGVERLILTASGGPFLHFTSEELAVVTPQMACQHPVWKMGKKITVDCATLMNKGLEVIEAAQLFQMSHQNIDVIIHPQSVIHSLVEYQDGTFLAQLGTPDMRIPISYCLSWPTRITNGAKRLSLIEVGKLTFYPPDMKKFRCLALAYDAIQMGGAAPIVLNASNEVAVNAFLKEQISFSRICAIIEESLQRLHDIPVQTIEDVIGVDKLAREQAMELIDDYVIN